MEAKSSYLSMLQKKNHFKTKDSELKLYSLYLGNISKDFTINNIKKGGLNGVAKVFSVDYNVIDTNVF